MDNDEIDYLVATQIMGWIDPETVCSCNMMFPNQDPGFLAKKLKTWKPTENMSDAFEVIAELGNLSFNIDIENCMGIRYDVRTYDDPDLKDAVQINCEDSLPLAICKLALKYEGIEI